MSMNKNSRFSRFVNGRGFYVALALCLVGAGTAAWVVVDRTLGTITDNGTPSSSMAPSTSSASSISSTVADFPTVEEEVDAAASNIEISSASSSSERTVSFSSEPQSVESEPSEQPVLSPEQQISAFVLPVNSAEVFNAYSAGELVKNTTLNKWSTHDGIDFKAALGTSVMAVADGTVTRIYDDGIWGRTVEISHASGLTSIYSGLSKETTVEQGAEVMVSQPIGTVGDTNLAEAKLQSHLHFAMKRDGKFVDPLETMGKL